MSQTNEDLSQTNADMSQKNADMSQKKCINKTKENKTEQNKRKQKRLRAARECLHIIAVLVLLWLQYADGAFRHNARKRCGQMLYGQ